MPNLALIKTEAEQLVGRMPAAQRLALQNALLEVCEAHWQLVRGPQPNTQLALTLWSVTPALADLYIDLYSGGESELDEVLPGRHFARGLALLVLAEIERGNEAGVHVAHEPMMAFETSPPPFSWMERITALLRGRLEPPQLHPHAKHHDAMWKALAVIAAHTRRLDLSAVLEVIRLLSGASGQTAGDAAVATLASGVAEVGICFLRIDDEHIYFEQHGHAHKPIRSRRLGEMLLEIRQAWLG